MNKKTIKDIQVSGKRVLVRCDFNVPQDDKGNITDESRIKGALPTIKYLIEQNAKIILCSHLGRPKGFDEKYSLLPVAKRLNEILDNKVVLANDVIGEDAKAKIATLKDGHIVLLQNVRYHKEEEKNDPEFAKQLASFGDVYVNDAFGTAHRAHASTEGVTKFINTSVAGFLIEKELNILGTALENPKRPFVAVLGGAKVSDKIGVIRNLLTKVDSIVIGGAMANTFLVALGGESGISKVEHDKVDLAKELMEIAKKNNINFYLPIDKVCCAEFSNNAPTSIHDAMNIPDNLDGMDIGPKTIAKFVEVISKAGTVVLNGPMGVFEMSNFMEGTRAIIQALADNKNCISIIGGGDSAAAAEQMGFGNKITHISTGGGASLEFLEGIELPGIACLNNK
ncbi:MAG: phosphoglycerate kinase [Firmicutes bacterium]|nr:phosphoglycerate kinase [Bacillota bacterium]MCL1954152.1 phosphoglycerate kinase [Bacillota bacterium]